MLKDRGGIGGGSGEGVADVGLNNWIGVSRRLYGDGEMSFEKSLES